MSIEDILSNLPVWSISALMIVGGFTGLFDWDNPLSTKLWCAVFIIFSVTCMVRSMLGLGGDGLPV